MSNSSFRGDALLIRAWNKGSVRDAVYDFVPVTDDKPYKEAYDLACGIRGKRFHKEDFDYAMMYYAFPFHWDKEAEALVVPDDVLSISEANLIG